MAMSITRRRFLSGELGRRAPVLRPPWALPEPEFLAYCTRCGECAAACPGHIITRGDGGYPRVDFGRGECSFCGECVAHCASGALLGPDRAAWAVDLHIDARCLALRGIVCQVCAEQCASRALRFAPAVAGVAAPQLRAAACSGCGACVAPCPVRAIAIQPRALHPARMEAACT